MVEQHPAKLLVVLGHWYHVLSLISGFVQAVPETALVITDITTSKVHHGLLLFNLSP
nr:MAG TPA: hypothetical protein [Caudoviricetes sp.]